MLSKARSSRQLFQGVSIGLAERVLSMIRALWLQFLALVGAVAFAFGLSHSARIGNACRGWTARETQEATLKMDLFTIRLAIDQFSADKKHAPRSLNDLVSGRYLPDIPVDPVTMKRDWVPHFAGAIVSPMFKAPGIDDVHSASRQAGKDGTTYDTW